MDEARETTYTTTFVRPPLDARPYDGKDRIYVTETDLAASCNPVWDLAGFPHLYQVAAEFSEEGQLIEVCQEHRYIAGLLRDLQPGGSIRMDVPVDALDSLFEPVVDHLCAQAAPEWEQEIVTSEAAYRINTRPESPGADVHRVAIVEIGADLAFVGVMTREQASFALQRAAAPRPRIGGQRP